MISSPSSRRAVLCALAFASYACTASVSAAQPSATLNGLRYDVVGAKRATSVGDESETVRARGTFVVLNLRVTNQTNQTERAFLLHAYLTGRTGTRYRVASSATDALSASDPSQNTLQEVHPREATSVVIAFDVPAAERDFKLHVVAHYPVVGIERVVPLRV